MSNFLTWAGINNTAHTHLHTVVVRGLRFLSVDLLLPAWSSLKDGQEKRFKTSVTEQIKPGKSNSVDLPSWNCLPPFLLSRRKRF